MTALPARTSELSVEFIEEGDNCITGGIDVPSNLDNVWCGDAKTIGQFTGAQPKPIAFSEIKHYRLPKGIGVTVSIA